METLDIGTVPGRVCSMTSMFLAIKYNPEALEMFVDIANSHNLMNDLVKQTDFRKYNLLHYSTKNLSTRCLR